jgi:hypothetical protein
MDKNNVLFIHNGVLFSHKEEQNFIVYRKMALDRDHVE